MRVTRLYLHPVKSLGGIAVSRFQIDRFGPFMDRRWLVVDGEGKFITQRQHACMALVRTALDGDRLTLSKEGQGSILFSPQDFTGPMRRVQVWRDQCDAQSGPVAVDQWISQALGIPCQIVFMPETTRRPVNPDYARQGETVSFADGFPLLLTTDASLADLNRRLSFSIGMERFRPNLVIDGSEPFAEDQWQRIRVGQMVFRLAKPCTRCVIPTIDPLTAEKQPEVFKTLKSFRERADGVHFGQNLLPESAGVLRLGDEVEILD